jgi:flagellar hook assembly protein FlgD
VAEAGRVQIRILDVAGRLVKTIAESARPGDNRVTWDGSDQSGRQVASGVYFYEIKAGGFSAERKMLLVD